MKTSKPNITLVKIGGNVIDDPVTLLKVLTAFSKIDGPKILVHGGGKEANKMAQSLGLEPQMIDGRRITGQNMLEVVVMTYAGLINKRIVAQLNAKQATAIGFSGADGNTIVSEKRKNPDIDFGFVGDIIAVNKEPLVNILEQNMVPVFCAITHDGNGQLLNTNADTVAAELSSALSETYTVKLIYCFEKQGVLINLNDNDSVIPAITRSKYKDLLEIGAIHSGMIPKLDNCFLALSRGVDQVIIGNPAVLEDPTARCTIISL